MKGLFVSAVLVFLFAGCTGNQGQATTGENKTVSAEKNAVVETQEQLTVTSEALQEQPLVTSEAVAETAQKNAAQIVLAPAVFEDNDEIIAAGAWGFSVFDPKTGKTDYYTSDGSLLGSRMN